MSVESPNHNPFHSYPNMSDYNPDKKSMEPIQILGADEKSMHCLAKDENTIPNAEVVFLESLGFLEPNGTEGTRLGDYISSVKQNIDALKNAQPPETPGLIKLIKMEITAIKGEVAAKNSDITQGCVAKSGVTLKRIWKGVKHISEQTKISEFVEMGRNLGLTYIAAGKAKIVFVPPDNLERFKGKVIYVATSFWKKAELMREVKISQKIHTKLQVVRLDQFLTKLIPLKNIRDQAVKDIIEKFGSVDEFARQMKNAGSPEKRLKILKDNNIAVAKTPNDLGPMAEALGTDEYKKPLEKLERWNANITTDLKVDRINGKEVVTTARADCDLDDAIRNIKKYNFTIEERLDISEQILQAMSDLHAAGFVHGDLKPDNFLITVNETTDPRTIQVKLADYGKAKEMPPGKFGAYTGNPRSEPPEKLSSQKGDVYAAKDVIIAVLERPYLNNNLDPIGGLSEEDMKSPRKDKRIGFERLRTCHKSFSQRDVADNFHGLCKVLFCRGRSNTVGPASPDHHYNEQDGTHGYVTNLQQKMDLAIFPNGISSKIDSLDPKMQVKLRAQKLMGAVSLMAIVDTDQRIDIDQALKNINSK